MNESNIPAHVGIIMDGNGRWAKKRGLPRVAGHSQGAKTFGEIARHAAKTEVKYLTVYAFSTENWKRPRDEVDAIMNLLRDFLDDAEKYSEENIRVIIIGDKTALDADIREKIRSLEEKSRGMTGLTLSIALNYGGRDDILHAAKSLIQRYRDTGEDPGGLDEDAFSRCLYTAGMPDADLVIRTSGEYRVSNFLLWQGAYAEYIFTDVLWPDFSPKDFDRALAEYSKRARRHGGV